LSPRVFVVPTLEIPSYDIVICEKQVVGTRALTRMEFGEIVQLVDPAPPWPTSVTSSPFNDAFEEQRMGTM
jgi:hypothetical protein